MLFIAYSQHRVKCVTFGRYWFNSLSTSKAGYLCFTKMTFWLSIMKYHLFPVPRILSLFFFKSNLFYVPSRQVQGVTLSPARYNNTQLLVGLLWKSDRPVADATQNTHNRKTFMLSAGFFCLFVSSCTLYFLRNCFFLCFDCVAFCLFVCTCITQHKHRCTRWDSNPQSQQKSERKPSP